MSKEHYFTVQKYQKTHPDEKISKILKKLKIPSSQYYTSRKSVEGQKPRAKKAKNKTKPTYRKIKAPEAQAAQATVTVIVGTPEQVRQVLQ